MTLPARTRLAALLAALPPALLAQTTWDFGGAPDNNWSTSANWSTNASPAATAVVFGSAGTTGSATTVGNIADTGYTSANSLSSLAYNNVGGASVWQVTQLASGVTLRVAGNFTVGGINGNASTAVTRAALTGPGALVIDNSASTFYVSNTNTAASGGLATAVLDLSHLSTFSATVNAFNYGAGTNGVGTVYLADNSTITATTISGGGTGTFNTWNNSVTNTLVLGASTTLNANTVSFATGRTRGSVSFRAANSGAANTAAASGPTLTIRGSSGGLSRANLSIGDTSEGGTWSPSGAYVSSADFSGGSVDAMVGTLTVGRAQRGLGGTNSYTGRMIVATGGIDATSVVIGQQAGNTGDGAATATLAGHLQVTGGNFIAGSVLLANGGANVNNSVSGTLDISGTANVNVTGDVTLARRVNVGSANTIGATVNIAGGTLSVGGNLTEGANANANPISSSVNLSGGALDMTGGIVAVDSFNFTGGTLRNVGAFTGNLDVQNSATLGFNGVNGTFSATILTGGLTLGAGANLAISLADGFSPGSGFLLVSNDGADSVAGTFATINGSAFGPGNYFTLTNDLGTYGFTLSYLGGDGNDLALSVSAVPEPSAFAALAGVAVLGMTVGRRRRNTRA